MRWLGVVAAVALAVGCSACGASSRPADRAGTDTTGQTQVAGDPATTPTIEQPANGARTAARSVEVVGRQPRAARDAVPEEVTLTLLVGDRQYEAVIGRDGRFRTTVALEPGPNEIVLEAEVVRETRGRRRLAFGSREIAVVRTPGSGRRSTALDRATAYAVSDFGPLPDRLCSISKLVHNEEDCFLDTRCFAVARARVDCPTVRWVQPDLVRRCAAVETVRLVGLRIYVGTYRCRGRARGEFRRFVRPDAEPRLRRFRLGGTDEYGTPNDVTFNVRNRYGVPRFDADRDVVVP